MGLRDWNGLGFHQSDGRHDDASFLRRWRIGFWSVTSLRSVGQSRLEKPLPPATPSVGSSPTLTDVDA